MWSGHGGGFDKISEIYVVTLHHKYSVSNQPFQITNRTTLKTSLKNHNYEYGKQDIPQ